MEKNSKPKKIALITGCGMDAKTLTHFLLSKNYHVVMTYRRNSSSNPVDLKELFAEDLKNNPQSSFSLEFCDITDSASVAKCVELILGTLGEIDEVYALAAQSHVGNSFDNPVYTINATGMGAYNLFECLRHLAPKCRIYQASTSEMFGGDVKNNPFSEKSPFECRSPYSVAKNLAYNWVKYFRQTYGMFISSGFLFNHSNIYRGHDFFIRHVTSSAAKIALGKIDFFTVGNLKHYRDEHLSDFGVEAMYKMLQLDFPIDLVIGNGNAQFGEDYLNYAFGYFNLDWTKYAKFDQNKIRPNEVVKLVADPRKAVETIGWIPNRIPFSDHIKLMCERDYDLEKGLKHKRVDVFSLY